MKNNKPIYAVATLCILGWIFSTALLYFYYYADDAPQGGMPKYLVWIFWLKAIGFSGGVLQFSIFFSMALEGLIMLLMLLGAVCLYFKQQAGARLLGFTFSIVLVQNFLELLLSVPIWLLRTEHAVNVTEVLISILLNCFWMGLPLLILRRLNSSRQLQAETLQLGEATITDNVTAGSGLRFLNLLIDSLLVTLLVISYSSYFVKIFGEELFDGPLFNMGTSLITYPLMIIYYLLFEGLLAVSPAKYLTGTAVADPDGKKAPFMNILGRTLCRLVPFESLTFIGRLGWHDTLSGTRVFKQTMVPVDE